MDYRGDIMANKINSLATKTLIQSSIRITVVIIVTTFLSYHFLSKYLVQEHHNTLRSTVSERVSREQILFPEVENYLFDMNRQMMRTSTIEQIGVDSIFSELFEKRIDGSIRHRRENFDPSQNAGLFIDDSTKVSTVLKERIVRFNNYNSMYGKTLRSKFTNLYILGVENYLMVYWPELVWTEQVTTEYRIWDEPYFSISTPENNPSKRAVWTPIYYDHIADQWMVSCVTPIYKNGIHIASTGMDILLNDLMERANREVIAGSSNIIISEDGKLIAHAEYVDEIKETGGELTVYETEDEILMKIFQKVSSDKSTNTISVFTLPDIPYVVAYGKINGPNWYYITLYQKEVLWSGVYRGVKIVLFSSLLALIIELLILHNILKRKVEEPLSDLLSAIRSISKGDFSTPMPKSEGTELTEIKDEFNNMQEVISSQIESLKSSRKDVEKEIEVRKQAEKERIIAFSKLQNIMNSTQLVAIIATDTNGLITHFNTGARKMLGYTEEEVVGQKDPSIIHVPEEVEQHANELFEQYGERLSGFDIFIYDAKRGNYLEKEWTFIRKNGSTLPVDLVITAIHDDNSNIIGFLGIAIDITVRKRAMDELTRTRQFLYSLINSMPSVVIGVTEDNIISFTNCSAQAYLLDGVVDPKTELFEQVFPDFISLMEIINSVRSSGKAHSERNKIMNISGEKLVFDQSIYPVSIESTKRTGEIVIRLDDVTKRHKKEQQEHQEQKMAAVGQLAGGVAHDFNNMLGAILGFSELSLEEVADSDESTKEYLSSIIEAAERASELTQKLLTFSRKGDLDMKTISTRDFVESAISLLLRTIDKKIIIDSNFPMKDKHVKGDYSQLQNAILNLGINARDAIGDTGGKIRIGVANCHLDEIYCEESSFELTPGEYVEVSIQDSGEGIKPELLQKIFEPFFTTKESGKGTGLGLAAVFGTLIDHNGAITVYSEVNRGTTFNLYIPIIDKSDDVEGDDKFANMNIHGSGNILLIDDEDMVRKVGTKTLEKLGYTVITADNGLNGLTKYEEFRSSLDVIVVDMIMPELSGDEVVKNIRENNRTIPIIIASGFTGEKNTKELLSMPNTYFIKKPFHKREFGQLIKEALNSNI